MREAKASKGTGKTNRVLGVLAVVGLGPLLPAIVSAFSIPLVRWGSLACLVIAVAAWVRKVHLPMLSSIWGRAAIIYISLIGAFMGFGLKTPQELQTLKTNDPGRYLAYIQSTKSDDAYMEALSEMRPDEYQAEVERREKAEAEKQAQLEAEKARRDAEAAEARARREAEAAEVKARELVVKREAYSKRLDREISGLKDFDASQFTDSRDSLVIGVALFSAWAIFYHEGAELELSADDQAKRMIFKGKLVQAQKRAFPKFRDALGPVMRQALWEADGSARTIGTGFTTVEFVAVDFAANRNIAAFQKEVEPFLKQMRFRQSRYKWFKDASEYTYYNFNQGIADSDIIVWNEYGGIRKREE